MKIAISSTGRDLESAIDPRFGRAEFFVLYDTDSKQCEAVENLAVTSSGGAGIATAQMMSDKNVEAVVTGNVGPNAMSVLRTAGIKIFRGNADTVGRNIENFNKGVLETIETTVAPHSGMGGQRGRG